MSKRSIEELLEDVTDTTKKTKVYEHVKKHTLDSEEEDSDVDDDRWEMCTVFKEIDRAGNLIIWLLFILS